MFRKSDGYLLRVEPWSSLCQIPRLVSLCMISCLHALHTIAHFHFVDLMKGMLQGSKTVLEKINDSIFVLFHLDVVMVE